jgi:hypothetical protein
MAQLDVVSPWAWLASRAGHHGGVGRSRLSAGFNLFYFFLNLFEWIQKIQIAPKFIGN